MCSMQRTAKITKQTAACYAERHAEAVVERRGDEVREELPARYKGGVRGGQVRAQAPGTGSSPR